MEDLARFNEAAVYKTHYGQRLLNDSPYSSAIYLAQFAHEMFAAWKESIISQYSPIQRDKWEINNTYQKSSFEIWEQISHYTSDTIWDKSITWTFQTFNAACQMILVFELSAITFAPMVETWKGHYAE